MAVHIGHSTLSGASCGRGSHKPDNDIVVSARTFFREIALGHRCYYCVLIHYPLDGAGNPDPDPAALDEDPD